jgi:hypothetical protein
LPPSSWDRGRTDVYLRDLRRQRRGAGGLDPPPAPGGGLRGRCAPRAVRRLGPAVELFFHAASCRGPGAPRMLPAGGAA